MSIKAAVKRLEKQRKRKSAGAPEVMFLDECTEAEAQARIAAKRAEMAAAGRGDAPLFIVTYDDQKPADEE
ncbi:MAG: hypothetical protein FJZ90_04865 [Chloroflexi bacterium]|nr:hypothetical protein [Chloroflexota bacterium]